MESEEDTEEGVEFDLEKWEEWEKLKKGDAPFRALKWGQENSIPLSDLKSFFAEIVERKPKSYGLGYNLRKSLFRTFPDSDWGPPEEIESLGVQAYQAAVEAGDMNSTINIALDVYGKDSSEYKNVVKRKKEIEEEIAEKEVAFEGGERDIIISSDATLADLFRELASLEEVGGLDSVGFKDELGDSFDEDLVEKIFDVDSQKSNIKVIDFFARYGHSKEDIETYLPIKFI